MQYFNPLLHTAKINYFSFGRIDEQANSDFGNNLVIIVNVAVRIIFLSRKNRP
ncbi:hypothetical protein BFO_0893 [Tannerella forsythia 92A2]|uniref:Uncharacterized protein n=1 Tax=Tannerella forsythia (strain ATCC 43037 / JCM 10827 / CCUG 21028 A / KCTC 5666 / FDC 338) TaxID=203275 RepID=G8UPF8_TANFA|nr:hypothetical protein BFO_0893 [Tannerella forsythia 92A2]BAR48394.1 hypothetical protein TF3313_0834 [Tannerella forsythia 3313]